MTERTRKAGGASPRFTVLLSLIFASQLKRAREHGITWATAAGNEANVHIRIRKEDEDAPATRFDLLISCPGQKISPSVITIGAVHHSASRCPWTFCPDGRLLFYSNSGFTGTSAASPHVAGGGELIWGEASTAVPWLELSLGNDVIICGDVVHIDTRRRAQPPC